MFFSADYSLGQNIELLGRLLVPCVSVGAAVVAIWAIRTQRHVNARRAYFDYVKVAFDNSEYAYPQNSGRAIDHKACTIDGDRVKYEKYEWFVSLLVVSVEGILEIVGRKSAWRNSALLQLAYHGDYFRLHHDKPWLRTKPLVHRYLLDNYGKRA